MSALHTAQCTVHIRVRVDRNATGPESSVAFLVPTRERYGTPSAKTMLRYLPP
jgi:hypothetical protein